MSNAEYVMLLVYAPVIKTVFCFFLKSDAHQDLFCFVLFVICGVMCYDHSSAASRFNMITSIPKKQVLMEG